ncbi:MAG: beta-lactamase family protein [Bacteroidetes bacterium]|nr:beta-lactamase family protein [Bacteroidota bacterium]
MNNKLQTFAFAVLFGILSALTLSSCATPEQRIDSIMKKFSTPNGPGASVLVMQNDSILFKKSYGLANLEEQRAVTPATNFRLASMTKQFTAMCIMMLAEQGKLSYDDKLSKFFPKLPRWGDSVTVKNLLTHTSGIVDYESLIPDSQTVQVHDDDVLKLVRTVDSTYFPVGSQYRYSNSGYSLLALIVEKVSGERFADFLKHHIFDVVGMPTTVAFENGISTVENRAYGYAKEDNTWKFADQSNTSAVLGDGGIYSNVEELAKWYTALFANTLIPKETQQRAWTKAATTDGKEIDYGFGWHFEEYKGITHPRHGGSTRGFRNEVQVYPDQHLVIIILTNRDEGDPMDEGHAIADLYVHH